MKYPAKILHYQWKKKFEGQQEQQVASFWDFHVT